MMRTYNSYKDSGIEWIGEIPRHWEVSRFKYKTKTPLQYGLNTSSENYTENGIRFVRITDINDESLLIEDNGKYLEEKDVPTEYLLNKYDVLFCRSGHTVGKSYLHLVDGKYTSGGYLVRLNFGNYTESKFVIYISRTHLYWDWIRLNTVVSTIENVNGEKYNNFIYPLPPISEQEQIVSYLDEKSSVIDEMVEKKKRKIELLKEYRTSLINTVVTKGLNPDVPMKDSGIEWIGEIPRHWEVKRLKYVCDLVNEQGIPKEDDIRISPENVQSDTGICSNYYSEYIGVGNKFINGDILFNKLRVYLKKIILTSYNGFSMGEMIVLRVKSVYNKYLYLTLFHQGLINLFNSMSTGVKLPRVSPDLILNSELPLPPPSEQEQIVSYLDEKTSEIDKTIELEKKKIELLKEYRQSLVSNVVTGKIKVTIQ